MKFEPISYEHAARLINKRPWDVSRNGELLVEAHETAIKTYNSSECIVGIDIYNIEIEAYGCEIIEPDGNGIPTAGTHPFEKVSDLIAGPFTIACHLLGMENTLCELIMKPCVLRHESCVTFSFEVFSCRHPSDLFLKKWLSKIEQQQKDLPVGATDQPKNQGQKTRFFLLS